MGLLIMRGVLLVRVVIDALSVRVVCDCMGSCFVNLARLWYWLWHLLQRYTVKLFERSLLYSNFSFTLLKGLFTRV